MLGRGGGLRGSGVCRQGMAPPQTLPAQRPCTMSQMLIVFTGFVAFGVNITVFLIIGKTSPVTYAILSPLSLPLPNLLSLPLPNPFPRPLFDTSQHHEGMGVVLWHEDVLAVDLMRI